MQHILAVSGVKNSGKTTLINRMIPFFTERGLKVAVIKHDGHEFEADVPGTDSWKHKRAGAYGTAVFSATKYMIVKEEPAVTFETLAACFPEADLILFEGGKFSDFPKIELVRSEISRESVCVPDSVLAYVTDLWNERELKILSVSSGLSDEPDGAASRDPSDLSAGHISDRKSSHMQHTPLWIQSGIPVFGFDQTGELCTYLLKKILKSDKISL